MEPIVLNHFIDNYEGSVSYLQFRFALGMYEWRKRKSGLLLLCPSKCEYRILILLILLKASFIAFVFGAFSSSTGTIPKLCVILADSCDQSSKTANSFQTEYAMCPDLRFEADIEFR